MKLKLLTASAVGLSLLSAPAWADSSKKPNFDDQLQILQDLSKIDLTEKEIAYDRKASSCDRHKSFGGAWVGDEDCGNYDINKVQKSTVDTSTFQIRQLSNGNYAILPKTPKPNNGAKLVKIGSSMGYSIYDWNTSETVKTMTAKGLLPQQNTESTQSAGKQSLKNNDTVNDLLTGDAKLACEAILCLSTGNRPSECNPSINKYFSIVASKPHKTIAKRRAFLQLCPTAGDATVSQTIEDIVNQKISDCTASGLKNITKKTKCRHVNAY